MSDGTVIIGGLMSKTVTCTTVIENDAVSVFPAESVAVQVTVVVPVVNVEPDGGEQDGAITLSISSVADTEYVATAPLASVASTTMSDGSEIIGEVVSSGIGFSTSTISSIGTRSNPARVF